MTEHATEDTVQAELDQLYRERERLREMPYTTPIRALRAREQCERVDRAIARLEAMRT